MNKILLSPNSDKSKDTTLELFRSLNSIHSNDNLKSEIEFEKGEYHFYSDFCREEFFYVSNNFDSLKRSPALMSDFDHLTIEGNGSEFIYHGEITPFIIDNCRHIELKNFSIDWERPFYSQGTVCETHEDFIVIKISPDYPYRVKGDKLLFLGEFLMGKMLGWSCGGQAVKEKLFGSSCWGELLGRSFWREPVGEELLGRRC